MAAFTPFAFSNPDDAIDALAMRLTPVDAHHGQTDLLGRVLAQSVTADRDSPAADVSAMDGYACVGDTLDHVGEIPVVAECPAGQRPPEITGDEFRKGVVRIFTGGIVPAAADRIIRREDTTEHPPSPACPLGSIQWSADARQSVAGGNIRRRGENVRRGEMVVPGGRRLHGPAIAAMAAFGATAVTLHRRVRVAVLTTGDELVDPGEAGSLSPWQLRNSNAVALAQILGSMNHVETTVLPVAADQPEVLRDELTDAIADHDVVLLTGGVSMGDHDYVPRVFSAVGGEIVFHKLPLRPGKPILGGVVDVPADIQGGRPGGVRLVLGLPGNPVSATLNVVRFAVPLIDKLAGVADWRPRRPGVMLQDPGEKTLPLHWMRPVRLRHDGAAELVVGQGSGDLASLALADGFIEMPPHATGAGPWPLHLF